MPIIVNAVIFGLFFVFVDYQFPLAFRALDLTGKASNKEKWDFLLKEYKRKFPIRLLMILLSMAIFIIMSVVNIEFEIFFIVLFAVSIFLWGAKAYIDCTIAQNKAQILK
jgi:hypothetical protein